MFHVVPVKHRNGQIGYAIALDGEVCGICYLTLNEAVNEMRALNEEFETTIVRAA